MEHKERREEEPILPVGLRQRVPLLVESKQGRGANSFCNAAIGQERLTCKKGGGLMEGSGLRKIKRKSDDDEGEREGQREEG